MNADDHAVQLLRSHWITESLTSGNKDKALSYRNAMYALLDERAAPKVVSRDALEWLEEQIIDGKMGHDGLVRWLRELGIVVEEDK
jgi:hypothetical protein